MSQRIPPRRKHARRIFVVVLVFLFAAGGVGTWWAIDSAGTGDSVPRRSPPGQLQKLPVAQRSLMGTSASILIYAHDEEAGLAAIEAAFQRGEEIAAICTDYDPDSELMRLSRAPVNEPIPVSPTLAAVLAHARTTAELTDGAFDPTLGPLTRLWRKSRRDKELPLDTELAAAREASGWENLEVNLEQRYVVLKKEGMRLDLGGIAKGYAADEMMRILGERGFPIAYIAIAGDVRLGAPPPGQRGWRVGIKTLGPELTQIIEVAHGAVSTSGDLYQYVDIDGSRYSHIIDPSTGLGLTRRIAATVVAPTAVQSDPLATFCCIKPGQALELFRAGEIACRIVLLRDGLPVDEATPQFPRVDAL